MAEGPDLDRVKQVHPAGRFVRPRGLVSWSIAPQNRALHRSLLFGGGLTRHFAQRFRADPSASAMRYERNVPAMQSFQENLSTWRTSIPWSIGVCVVSISPSSFAHASGDPGLSSFAPA